MDYPVLAGCGLTRSDAAKVLPLVLLVCQRGCKWSANPLHIPLSSRLSDSHDLSSHLSDTPAPSLVDQLNLSESMDVENPLAIILMAIDDPHLAAINNVMATAGPLVLDPVQYDNPWRPGDPDNEDEEEDKQMKEVGWKKTKRGR